MINQKKTGQFIADIRKEKGLTQRQLAEEIGVSDKAISRWETGRGMPDTSIMPDLCKVLDISINDLLSGQRLSSDDYCGKAEENMVELIKTNEDVKRQSRKAVVGTVVGIILLCLFIYLITLVSGGVGMVIYFIDPPSLISLLGIQLIILGASGHFAEFFRSFKLLFFSKRYSDEELMLLSEKSEYAITFGIRTTLLAALCVALIGFVLLMHNIADPATIGPNLAVMVLTALYACIISLILLVIKGRLHRFHA
ncbi:helix-turn-helix domain-containing protein [Butyrivibrio sp.]|uniref:helix-turn-helix domain-containing protein n=1 Tax=Butyrivibrio sp. TaxID=28121 RepID=UPI0025C3A077|nr:helix-turn-helix domain-containing protein [Butyrivibrio sp.]